MPPVIFRNATVSTTRNGAARLMNERVQMDFPTKDQRVKAEGGLVPVYLYDSPGTDWQEGDIVTVVALDGFATPPSERYVCGLVERVGGFLPILRVQLTTSTGQF